MEFRPSAVRALFSFPVHGCCSFPFETAFFLLLSSLYDQFQQLPKSDMSSFDKLFEFSNYNSFNE
jgi:hypothetical protein